MGQGPYLVPLMGRLKTMMGVGGVGLGGGAKPTPTAKYFLLCIRSGGEFRKHMD